MKNACRIDFTNNTCDVLCYDPEIDDHVPVTIDLERLKVVDAAIDGTWTVTRTSPNNPTQYAYATVTRGSKRTVYMHRLLCPTNDLEVAHLDGNGLNNQTANLKGMTISQHRLLDGARHDIPWTSSRTGVRGVRPNKSGKRYEAYHHRKHLGTFDTVCEAQVVAKQYRDSLYQQRLAA